MKYEYLLIKKGKLKNLLGHNSKDVRKEYEK